MTDYSAWSKVIVPMQQSEMSENTIILLVVMVSFSIVMAVISVGSLNTAKELAKMQQGKPLRTNDELFIGQAAQIQIRQQGEELKAIQRENDRLRDAMRRYGIDPESGRSMPITAANTARNRLRQEMINGLSENEVRSVCFHLNIDDEALADDDKVMLIESLLEVIERSNRQFELFEVLVKIRPERHWISNW